MTEAGLWSAIQRHKAETDTTPTHAYASPRTIQALFAAVMGRPYGESLLLSVVTTGSDGPSCPVMQCCGVFVVPRRDVPPDTFYLEVAP